MVQLKPSTSTQNRRVRKRCLAALTTLLLCLVVRPVLADVLSDVRQGGFSLMNDKPEILAVDEAFRFGSYREEEGVRVFWQVMPGYYLYRDKFRFRRVGSQDWINVELPAGEQRDDEVFGLVQVLEGLVEVSLPLEEGAALEVYYQGCAAQGYCYPPQKKQLTSANVDATLNM